MTDIARWSELIHRGSVLERNIGGELTGGWCSYMMIPVNNYLMANLLDALTQSKVNGDWYGEWCDIIAVAMEKSGTNSITSNTGKIFTYEKIKKRDLS